MSQTLSSSFARCYGLARVAPVWKVSRASVYRSRKETPPDTIARRPGPIGACSDAELADHIRRHIAASRLHGEGLPQVMGAIALCWRSREPPPCATGDAREWLARAASRWTHRGQVARWDNHH
jgi:hypothetical protein